MFNPLRQHHQTPMKYGFFDLLTACNCARPSAMQAASVLAVSIAANVRFTPKSTELVQCRECRRCALGDIALRHNAFRALVDNCGAR